MLSHFPTFHFEFKFCDKFYTTSYKSFLRRPNGSELKLCPKIAEINFSYFAKIPPWLEIVGRKNQPHTKG